MSDNVWCYAVVLPLTLLLTVDGSRSTGFNRTELSTDTKLNKMQYN